MPGKSDKLISSQSRYGLFGTSPFNEGSAYESEPLLLYYIFEGFSNTFYSNSEISITYNADVRFNVSFIICMEVDSERGRIHFAGTVIFSHIIADDTA